MRNFTTCILLTIGIQNLAWAMMDYYGIIKYGETGWPYTLNPSIGIVIFIVTLIASACLIEKKITIPTISAVAIGITSGIRFWRLRAPANPYRDYGEDNIVLLVLQTGIAIALMGIATLLAILSRPNPKNSTDNSNQYNQSHNNIIRKITCFNYFHK